MRSYYDAKAERYLRKMALGLSFDCSNLNNTYALKTGAEYPGHWPHTVAWLVICGIVLTNLVLSIPDIIEILKQWYCSYRVLSGPLWNINLR